MTVEPPRDLIEMGKALVRIEVHAEYAAKGIDDLKDAQKKADDERKALGDRVTRLEGHVTTSNRLQATLSVVGNIIAGWFGARAP